MRCLSFSAVEPNLVKERRCELADIDCRRVVRGRLGGCAQDVKRPQAHREIELKEKS